MIEQERISCCPFPGDNSPTFIEAEEFWEDNDGEPMSDDGVLIGTHGDEYRLDKNHEGAIALRDACGQLVTSWYSNAVDIFAVDTDDDGHDEIYVDVVSSGCFGSLNMVCGLSLSVTFRHVIGPEEQCVTGEFWRSGAGVYQNNSPWP